MIDFFILFWDNYIIQEIYMIFPVSGAVQLFGFFTLLIFAIRCFLLSRKEINKISLFFGIGFLLLSLSRLFLAIPCLVFLENKKWWFIFELLERSFLVGGFSFLGYGIFLPTKLGKYINKIFLIFILVSISIIIGFYLRPPEFFIRENGVLDWKNIPFFPAIINFVFIFFLSISAVFLFIREFYLAVSNKVKARSLTMALVFLWAILPAIFDFFAIPLLNINPLISEINYFICYFLILLTVIIGHLFEIRQRENKKKI